MISFLRLPVLRRPFESFIGRRAQLTSMIRSLTGCAYQYERLTDYRNQMRVVQIFPALTTRADEPIRCTIQTVSLDDLDPEYRAWNERVGSSLLPRKRVTEWHAYNINKNPDRTTYTRWRWGDYIALSYAWGSSDRSHSIILDGEVFRVPMSVELALRSLRPLIAVGDGFCRVWLDYLCINQNDGEDKRQQMMRMQTIFGDSFAVMIHLGEADPETDMALDLINQISADAVQGFNFKMHLFVSAVNHHNGTPYPYQKAYLAVCKLLARPYWRRMWIVQELAMGDDFSDVLCGDRITSLHDVRLAMKLIEENVMAMTLINNPDELGIYSKEFNASIPLLWWVGRLRTQGLLWQTSESVSYVELRSPALALAQNAEATYQYDKVFGILSLLPPAISMPMEPLLAELPVVIERSSNLQDNAQERDRLISDYTKRVFTQFVTTIIRSTNDLDVILARNSFQKIRSTLDLPSWVTDWTLRPDRGGFIPPNEWHFDIGDDILKMKDQNSDPLQISRQWSSSLKGRRADAGRNSTVEFLDNDRLLSCQAISIGRIDGIAPVPGIGDDSWTKYREHTQAMVQSQDYPSPYGSNEEAACALTRTLFLDPLDELDQKSLILSIPWLGDEIEPNAIGEIPVFERDLSNGIEKLIEHGWGTEMVATMFVSTFSLFEMIRRYLAPFRLRGIRFKDYFPSEMITCPGQPLPEDFSRLVANFANRRLVTTTTGHFGLAPSIIKPGDQIFVILGCSIPVILRPSSHGHYEVVGECYVDGFMKGECMQGVDQDIYEVQEIVLC